MANNWEAWKWVLLALFVGVYAWGAFENRHLLREIVAEIGRNRRRVPKYAFFLAAWLYLVWRDEVTTLFTTALLTWAFWPAIRARWFISFPDDGGLMDDAELGRTMRELLKR